MSLSLGRKLDDSMGTLQRLVFSFANTDEIFAVASSQPGRVGKAYLYGLMTAPWFGWTLGTVLGAAAGTLLPVFVRSALGIALYGMFLAIIVPPARKDKFIAVIIAVCFAASFAVQRLPLLSGINSGTKTIILTLIIASAAAVIRPKDPGAEPEKEAPDA
jgi:predicted branched-subunit amino acid permease